MKIVGVFIVKGIEFIGGYLMVGFYKSGVVVFKVYLFENVMYVLIFLFFIFL